MGLCDFVCRRHGIDDVSGDSIKKAADELSFLALYTGKIAVTFRHKSEDDMSMTRRNIISCACIARIVENFNQVDLKSAYNWNVNDQSMVKCEEKDPEI